MTITLRSTCDRCGIQIDLCETSLVEVRSGRERTRKPLDLCQACHRDLLAWLGERTSGGGAS